MEWGWRGWGRGEGQGCLPLILCHVTVSTMCISLRKKVVVLAL